MRISKHNDLVAGPGIISKKKKTIKCLARTKAYVTNQFKVNSTGQPCKNNCTQTRWFYDITRERKSERQSESHMNWTPTKRCPNACTGPIQTVYGVRLGWIVLRDDLLRQRINNQHILSSAAIASTARRFITIADIAVVVVRVAETTIESVFGGTVSLARRECVCLVVSLSGSFGIISRRQWRLALVRVWGSRPPRYVYDWIICEEFGWVQHQQLVMTDETMSTWRMFWIVSCSGWTFSFSLLICIPIRIELNGSVFSLTQRLQCNPPWLAHRCCWLLTRARNQHIISKSDYRFLFLNNSIRLDWIHSRDSTITSITSIHRFHNRNECRYASFFVLINIIKMTNLFNYDPFQCGHIFRISLINICRIL